MKENHEKHESVSVGEYVYWYGLFTRDKYIGQIADISDDNTLLVDVKIPPRLAARDVKTKVHFRGITKITEEEMMLIMLEA